MKTFCFIINPKSGSHLDISGLRHLCQWLRSRGDQICLNLTRSLEHAGELAAMACQSNTSVIIVAGGDGTVRSVLQSMAGCPTPVMILPCGTENLLASELGLDGSIKTTIQCLEHGLLRNLDLGRVNGRIFTSIVGVGFDAEVVQMVHQGRSGHITHADYIWPICRTFWEHNFPHFQIEADGKLVCDEPALAFVGNISRYAVGLKILPDANCSDGFLHLCIYKCRKRRTLLKHSLMTVLGKSHTSPQVVRLKCRDVIIRSPQPQYVQIDGDPGPLLPLHIESIPHAVKVFTPPPPPGKEFAPPVRHYHLRKWLLH